MANDDVQNWDPHAANAAAYDVAVQKIFCRLDIPWQWILDTLVGVVSDGATVMGSYVARFNAARPSNADPIVWIRDAAHGLMRSVAHGKAAVRTWYKALDLAVSLMCIFYRISSKRMRVLGQHGGKHCFQRRTGVPLVEAMGRELTIVLQIWMQPSSTYPNTFVLKETHNGRRRPLSFWQPYRTILSGCQRLTLQMFSPSCVQAVNLCKLTGV